MNRLVGEFLAATDAPVRPATTPPSAKAVFLVTPLNDRWRVIGDPLQWLLQYRAGNISDSGESQTRKAWQGRRYCRTRDALIRDIGELCGPVDPSALAVIEALPDRHVDRDRSRAAMGAPIRFTNSRIKRRMPGHRASSGSSTHRR